MTVSRNTRYIILAVLTLTSILTAVVLYPKDSRESDMNLPVSDGSIKDFNIAAVGDFGCTTNAEETIKNIQEKEPELFLALGDFSYADTADCWIELVEPIDQITRIVIGNHEAAPALLLEQYMSSYGLTERYYSFDQQNIHFIVMDTDESYAEGSAQYEFVVDDLSRASSSSTIDWIVVAMHRYPYSLLGVTQPEDDLREIYHPLFQQYGVDLVLSGHEHNYQRTYPLRFNSADPSHPIITDSSPNSYKDPQAPIFLIIGTGGVNLFPQVGQQSYIASKHVGYGFLNIDVTNNGTTLVGTFYSNDGTINDQFTNTKSVRENNVPISHAGVDRRVLEGANVTLDGSGSVDLDGDLPLRYKWKQLAGASNVTLLGSDSATARFIAPSVSAAGDTLVFELTTTDSKGLQDPVPDSVIVVVSDNPYQFEPYLTLSGSNYSDFQSAESLELVEFTVGVWFKTTFTVSNGTESVIVAKGGINSETPGDNLNYGILMAGGGRIKTGFETTAGEDFFVTSSRTFSDGLWHFATATFDGATIRLYVDRELVGSTTVDGVLPDYDGALPLRVGANAYVADRYFVGSVDELRVWNRALSPSEVTDMYLTGVASARGQVLHLAFGNEPS
jgi:hypothetical protein